MAKSVKSATALLRRWQVFGTATHKPTQPRHFWWWRKNDFGYNSPVASALRAACRQLGLTP